MHVPIEHEGIMQEPCPYDIFSLTMLAEEVIIFHDFRDVPMCFAMLMDTIHCLYLEYTHKINYSFEFLQRVIMKIKKLATFKATLQTADESTSQDLSGRKLLCSTLHLQGL